MQTINRKTKTQNPNHFSLFLTICGLITTWIISFHLIEHLMTTVKGEHPLNWMILFLVIIALTMMLAGFPFLTFLERRED